MEPAFLPARDVTSPHTVAQSWWDRNADEYLRDHPSLGEVKFQWGPEGWTEDDLAMIPRVPGRILEVGAGAAQCSRWLAARGDTVIATDISQGMLNAARLLNKRTGIDVPLVQADITALPFSPESFDTVFTSFGALSFLPNLERAFAEIFRVLAPGGTWVYSVTHPFSWVFPDSPYADDLTVIRPYGREIAYVENDSRGTDYAEFPHTIADHVNALAGTGFRIQSMLEPGWPAGNESTWGAWGPDRGAMLPGTLIVSALRPAS